MKLVRWNKAFALNQVAGDRELLKELNDTFRTSFEADYGLLQKAVAENSDIQVARVVHSIKGAASNLGFEGIAELAGQIEKGSGEERIVLARKALDTFAAMLGELAEM